jgi:DeoR/GlpR family transcriptional regulator of sugar metabolism
MQVCVVGATATFRRDLTRLEDAGQIVRVHAGAELLVV